MKKKNPILPIIIIVVVLLATAGLIGTVVYKTQQTGLSSGLYIKSISKNIDVISSDTDLKGVWFLIDATTGGGQSVVGTLTPEETNSMSGTLTTYPLTIEVSAIDEKVEYLFKATGQNIYQYDYTIQKSSDGFKSGGDCKTFLLIPYKDAPSCPSTSTYSTTYRQSNGLSGYACWRYCTTKKQTGVLSIIEPSKLIDEANIKLTVNAQTITQKVSQSNSNADFFISGKGMVAQVQFPTTGWTGNFPPSATDYYGYYDLNQQSWRITSKSRIDSEYSSALIQSETQLKTYSDESGIRTQCNSATGCYSLISKTINGLNSVVTTLKADDMSITQNSVWTNRNDKNNGKMVVSLDRQIGQANLIIKARADWLGIKIEAGKPQISGKSCNEFRSGDKGNIQLNVKNIGSATGNFIASIDCKDLMQSFNPSPVTIKAGQTETMNIPINSGTIAKEFYDTCEIKVQDINKASNYDTDSVRCHILKPATCTENDYYLEGNCIKICKNGEKNQLKCCGNTEEITYDTSKVDNGFGGYSCVTKGNGGGNGGTECAWYDLKCQLKNSFAGYFTVGILVLSFLFGLLMFAIMLGMFKQMELGSPTDMVVSIIFGIGTGFLFYYYIWFAILFFVLAIIIWIILPKPIKGFIRKGLG